MITLNNLLLMPQLTVLPNNLLSHKPLTALTLSQNQKKQ